MSQIDVFIGIGIMIIPLIISMVSAIIINQNRKIKNDKKLSGFEVAKKIIDGNGLLQTYIVESKETVTNHYDVKRNVLRLDSKNFHGEDLASMIISAQKASCGVIAKENNLLKLRSLILNFLNFVSIIGYIIAFIGIFMKDADIMYLGIVILGMIIFFYLACLNGDLKASNLAKKELIEYKFVKENEISKLNSLFMITMFSYFSGMITAFSELSYILKNMIN